MVDLKSTGDFLKIDTEFDVRYSDPEICYDYIFMQ